MKKVFSHGAFTATLFVVVLVSLTITSCKKKAELPTITEWETYQDPINGSEIQYPKGWLRNSDPKRTKIYSSQIVADKFYDFYTQGSITINEEQGGVEIEVSSERFADANVGTLDGYKAKSVDSYGPLNLSNEQPASFGKETGVKFSFGVKVGKETNLRGEKWIIAHDSAFYTVSISGFNEYFEVYKPLLEKIIESIKLPKPKVSYKDPNAASLPSPDVTKFTNDFVEFEHPQNFDVTMPKEKKGGAIHSLHVEGLRKDCTFDLEIFLTKTDKGEVKFEKFVEDNKAKFKPKSTGSDKIDGINSVTVVASSPAKNIERKVFFVTKGERIYQIVLTWYQPMAEFKPAFEKIVASLKLK
ncbi:MAG: hypothetical protein Q8L88_02780 [Bacteroidota bacterium]|nr:hypothetical protein [Bacteroidota bacterium]